MEIDRLIAVFRLRKIFVGICLGILLFNLLFYFGFIKNQQKKIDKLQTLYLSDRKKITKPSKKNDKMEKYIHAKESLQVFVGKLPYKFAFTNKVKVLNEMIARHGLSVDRMTFSPQKIEVLSIWRYATIFTVNGQYGKLKSLLADIQNSPDLFCIEDLSFQNKSKTMEQVSMNLKISTYFK